ncbi:helix-hairpin-helix domain-containing protein [Hymenobacter sp. BT770]|uniref:helix-hairpin-helix domain-containing protein n=1 Tax=Hymenobacter sp. BT770 TaxID=2886942 RepID=UPI001D128B76|nr:helix-hairpin-helix domain-containing protein [Hymenobacter sp. BT770]MCC3153858.1 helix-hairpin-helix domain-containing protein [Hymenobacter sp. BT770]MDO3416002.1 helix-hairpin-helix domain-containing protein [Hymenobacter sp. BT770]
MAATEASAQDYTRRPPDLDRLTQELFAEIQSDQVPYEDLYETLLQYYQTPINLNTATREELRALLLLNENQITTLLLHRQANGDLLSVYELQSIEGYDLRTISRILPFVSVQSSNLNAARGSLWQRIAREDNNALYLRYERVLQERQGYTSPTLYHGQPTTRYLGSPDKMLIRYRVSHTKDFSVGFSLEKDAGEPLSWNPGSGRLGADYVSAHVLLQERGRLKTLALGDYQLQFGQGLLLSSGLGVGKGAETITTLRRSSVGVRAYASLLENTFFRGGAATVQVAPTVQATAFVSHKNVDANLQQAQDSLAQFDEFTSGLLYTGFHRTASEIANRHQLSETIGGGNLGYTSRDGNLALGATGVFTHYGTPLLKRAEPYNRFEFSGKENLALSLNYSYVWRNLLLFGETARSTGGGLGTVNGLLASLGPTVDAALLVRHYDADFHTLYGNAFSENTRNINESGVYFGLKVRPVARWEVSAYYDQFRFPWLRYRASAPTAGHDALVRLAYTPSKTSLLYLQLRQRLKPRDLPSDDVVRPIPLPGEQLRQSLLLYYNTAPSTALELRTRLQASRLRDDPGLAWRRGYVLAQDVSYQLNRTLKLTARYAVFDADDYDTRQYVYEHDVLLAVSVPALYGQGTRVYGLAEIRLNRSLTLWLRYAETRYRHQQTVGSGLETIQGALRSEVKAQLRVKF